MFKSCKSNRARTKSEEDLMCFDENIDDILSRLPKSRGMKSESKVYSPKKKIRKSKKTIPKDFCNFTRVSQHLSLLIDIAENNYTMTNMRLSSLFSLFDDKLKKFEETEKNLVQEISDLKAEVDRLNSVIEFAVLSLNLNAAGKKTQEEDEFEFENIFKT